MANKQLLKKILAVLIIVGMIMAVLLSCTEKKEDDTQTTTQSTTDSETASVQEDNGTYRLYEEARVSPDLPDTDWEGYTFKVLIEDWAGTTQEGWQPRDIAAEEETAEPINDAVYRRNAALKEKYNFTVAQVLTENIGQTLKNAFASGDGHFDAVSMNIVRSARGAQGGFYVDLYGLRYLDFEKPWWDKAAVAGISIGNKLFFVSGDCVLANKDACPTILFNKKLIDDLTLENPYELVRGGQWTISKLYEMAKAAASDLDGNGKMDWATDRFGYIPNTGSLIQGMGVRIAGKDADDLPVLTYESERTFTAAKANLDLFMANFTWKQGFGSLLEGGDDIMERTFEGNRGLFLLTGMRSVEHLRTMDTDFGILPLPWLDENQREWGHSVDTAFGQAMAIPDLFANDNLALDRVGFMLEAIAAESRYTVIPAYYDIQLTSKFTRDEESREMLDIIFGSMVWDTGMIYDWLGLWTGNTFPSTASAYESRLGVIEAAMKATIDDFAKLD